MSWFEPYEKTARKFADEESDIMVNVYEPEHMKIMIRFLLEDAKKKIDISYHEFTRFMQDDKIFWELVSAARRGVPVRILTKKVNWPAVLECRDKNESDTLSFIVVDGKKLRVVNHNVDDKQEFVTFNDPNLAVNLHDLFDRQWEKSLTPNTSSL